MAARTRYVFLSLVVVTGILAAVFAHAAGWLFDALAVANPSFLGRQLKLSELVGFGAAFGLGFWAWAASRPRELLGEVVDELLRVSWPSRQETTQATFVVLVCVVVSAACLGVFDGLWLALTGAVLGSPHTAPPSL